MRVLILIALVLMAAPFVRFYAQEGEVRATHWPNGRIRSEIQVRRNMQGELVREGPTILYHEVGGIAATGRFKNDREIGNWIWFTPERGHEAVCVYKNGIGEYRRLYPDGKVFQEGEVDGDKRRGPWREYHPSGRLRLEGEYVNDLQHGAWIYHADEDNPKPITVLFKDGQRVGGQ